MVVCRAGGGGGSGGLGGVVRAGVKISRLKILHIWRISI